MQTPAGDRSTVAVNEAIKHRDRRPDPLRRFVPTPWVADVTVMDRTLRLETNSPAILEQALKLFSRYATRPKGSPQFLWRIVSEAHETSKPPWPERSIFWDDDLRFAQFGQRNFLAVDLRARQGIAFLGEGLAGEESGFSSPFLDSLFYMTAGSLGLTALSSACVALGEKSLLVLGASNQGKTTACYLASRLGLEFVADQAVFVEQAGGILQAWGEFWPAAFRPDAFRFLPELRPLCRQFFYCDFTFHYMDKGQFQTLPLRPITPAGCVFLRREAASRPQLSMLAPTKFSHRLRENLPFREDGKFRAQRDTILGSLGKLPAYDLAYGNDPMTAAKCFHSLLAGHDVPR